MIDLKNDILNKVKLILDEKFDEMGLVDENTNIYEIVDRYINDEVAALGLDYDDEEEFLNEYKDEIIDELTIYINNKFD